MTSRDDVQHGGEPTGPRVITLPSPRRLLRPGPTLVLLAVLVGAASAPPGQGSAAESRDGRSQAAGSAASAAQVPSWQEEADPRASRPVTGTGVAPASSPVALPLSPVVLVGPPTTPGSPLGVGSDLWAAYRSAAAAVSPSCHLDPRLLAAIGQVESGSLAGRTLDARHRAVPPVLGPVLDGNGVARIPDTDGGRLDGDPVWDRAVGPMQFIPSTWARWGFDADGDGVADPQDIVDASQSAADYLCAGGRDLAQAPDLQAAILSYNHSTAYLATVLALVPRMGPGTLGTGAGALLPALFVGPPSGRPATLPVAPAAPVGPVAAATTSSSSPNPVGTPRTATRTWTAGPTTSTTSASATTTATAAPSTSATSTTSTTSSPTSSTASSPTSATPTSTATTAPVTSSTTTAPATSTTATSSPSSSTTTPACPDGSTSSPTTSGTTSPSSPSGTASPSPTASCTSTASARQTPVPSTSSATAAEATLLGHAG